MAEETKKTRTEPATGGQPTVKVTFARDFTLSGGAYDGDPGKQSFKNGDVAEIPTDRIGEVLMHGYARPHDARLAKIYGFPQPEENKEG